MPAIPKQPLQKKDALEFEFGPTLRTMAARYFSLVRFTPESVSQISELHTQGFVVHVMRTSGWLNYLYLAWALVRRGLPPVRAVVNLTGWFTKPWRHSVWKGSFEERFTTARNQDGSGLIFLRESAWGNTKGRNSKEDPFPALVAMARQGDRNVFLVPELFVWEKVRQRLKPSVFDYLFGSPESPGFFYSLIAFWRNHHRAQFRVGEPINLRQFILKNAHDSDVVIARNVRTALTVHLAQETRAVFGPPPKSPDRFIEEAMRDRILRKTLDEIAEGTKRRPESVYREARKVLKQIAARLSPTVVALSTPVLNWIFNRIYDGIEVDQAGLDRAMQAAKKAPIVLVPSHKSHMDYLILSYVFWEHGYQVPLVAAGANLSFFPLGPYLRRGGAFFLRRSFKGDKIYTAVFKAYLKKLVFDGVHQEFFPEGGRSRTGKLLEAKLGLLSWEVDAVLEGARDDLAFLPVSIDYEKVVESGSYSKELAGGEKKPEDFATLLSTPKVLTKRYGRIYLTFNEPIFLSEVMRSRGLINHPELLEEQKRGLVRALGNRIMFGISRVSTVTPYALVAAGLLAHRRRGISVRELTDKIILLRSVADAEKVPLSLTLKDAPSDPTVIGPIKDAMSVFVADGVVRATTAKQEIIFQVDDTKRTELLFPKNTIVNLLASRSIVATAILAEGTQAEMEAVQSRALFLSKLLKFEFVYESGIPFPSIFQGVIDHFIKLGLVQVADECVSLTPEPFAKQQLEFLADLIRDFLESYLIAVMTLTEHEGMIAIESKNFIKLCTETGRAAFLEGRLGTQESLARTNLENAIRYLQDQKFLSVEDKNLSSGERPVVELGRLRSEIEACLAKASF